MLYHAFDMQKSWLAGASALATAGAQVMQHPANPLGYFGTSPLFASALEVFAHAAASRGKPGFDLSETVVNRSEQHTSDLHSLMRTSYAVFLFIKKQKINIQ